MLLTYKNEITILYSGECRNTYFEIKRSGGSDEQNKQNKEKKGGLIIPRSRMERALFDFGQFLWSM